MARLVKVAEADELLPGQAKLVQVEGEDIALFNVNGTYYATGAVCPHEDGPLQEGEVEGDSVICPWHGYDFNLKTGECRAASELRVPAFVVTNDATGVYIEVT